MNPPRRQIRLTAEVTGLPGGGGAWRVVVGYGLNSVSVWVAPPPAGVTLPTAQACPEGGSADAPLSWDAEPGAGLAAMFQLVPSQCSMRVAGMPLLLSDSPTAQTSLLETTAAPARLLNTAPDGPGLGTTAQLVPFHRSVSVPLPLSPTAHTSVVDTAATPRSSDPEPVPPGLGLGTMLHAVPSQCSVSVWNTVPALVEIWKSPTAQTSLAEMAVTPVRRLFPVPSLGLGTMAQF